MQFVMLGIVLLSVPYSVGKIFYYYVVVQLEQGHTIKAMFNALFVFITTFIGLAVAYWVLSIIPMIGILVQGIFAHKDILQMLMGLIFAEISIMMIMIAGKFWIEH